VWGPRSRIALRDFKSFNGLGFDDKWELRVQLALFNDGSRIASAAYIPPDPNVASDGLYQPFSPPPGSTLHPLNPSDATVIQSRLSELGYYRVSGDGVWGQASRSALQDFKVANGLPADDVWNSDVQWLLTSDRVVPAAETPFGQWARVGTSCTDTNNPGRLFVSAKEIVAGQSVCRWEQSLTRSRGFWVGSAMCSRNQEEAMARVALKIVGGQLIDQSLVGSVPNPRPPVFERCRL
jgi:hypothetical protein